MSDPTLMHSYVSINPELQGVLNAGRAVSRKPAQSKTADDSSTSKIEVWGEDNDYPKWLMEQIADVSLIKPILAWKAEALYGNGLSYGIERIEKGKKIFEPLFDPEIDDWMDETNIMQYVLEATSNFYHFYNVFPTLCTSNNGQYIKYLHCKESIDSRWGKRNTKGYVDKMYLSPDWSKYDEKHKDTLSFDVYNHFLHNADFVKKNWKNKEFAFPFAFPSPGKSFYQEAPWHVLIKSWLPIWRKIPKYKDALMNGTLTIRYIIEVPDWYWKEKYPGFEDMSEKKQKEIVDAEHVAFDNFFKDKNAGNSLMVMKKTDYQDTKYASWNVITVDNKTSEGAYIEDSQEAEGQIFKNMQVDSTIFGNSPGKNNNSSGSGSDKRVARNNYILQTKSHQDLLLRPLQFIAKYNGWDKRLAKSEGRLKFHFENYMIAKLDEGGEIKKSEE